MKDRDTGVADNEAPRTITRETVRFVAGPISGGIISFFIFQILRSTAMQRAAGSDAALNSWGILWGDFYGWMILVSLFSIACGACVAGIITRRKGGEVGALSSIPLFTIFSLSAYLELYNGSMSSVCKAVLVFLILATIPLAVASGRYGAKTGSFAGDHFDNRPNTFLGIKWYHYFWIPFAVSISLKEMWGLVLLSGTLLQFLVMLVTVWLTLFGFRKTYRILSDFEHIESPKARVLRLAIFGICLPLASYFILRAVLGERVYMSY